MGGYFHLAFCHVTSVVLARVCVTMPVRVLCYVNALPPVPTPPQNSNSATMSVVTNRSLLSTHDTRRSQFYTSLSDVLYEVQEERLCVDHLRPYVCDLTSATEPSVASNVW